MVKDFIWKCVLGFLLMLLEGWHWITIKSEVALILLTVLGLVVIAYSLGDLTTARGWREKP